MVTSNFVVSLVAWWEKKLITFFFVCHWKVKGTQASYLEENCRPSEVWFILWYRKKYFGVKWEYQHWNKIKKLNRVSISTEKCVLYQHLLKCHLQRSGLGYPKSNIKIQITVYKYKYLRFWRHGMSFELKAKCLALSIFFLLFSVALLKKTKSVFWTSHHKTLAAVT